LKVYYAEDDGGSVLVSPVNPEIKAAVRRTVMFLEKAHGIKAQKVNVTTQSEYCIFALA